ncbi:MAG: DUF1566 domain-containing protein, partial [Nitrospirae bacterium]|nr:DUF1566 domain-containing protein [Nitrospirota bacterium]
MKKIRIMNNRILTILVFNLVLALGIATTITSALAVMSTTPYTSDANTVLLDHFDGATSASILAYTEVAGCGSPKPSATPSSAYVPGPSGLSQALNLNPPVGEPAGSATYLQYPGGQLLAAFNMNSGTTTVPLNTWTHVAATWGSTGAKLYINGVLVGSDVNTGMPASGFGGSVLLRLGTYAGNNAQIDELRISNVQRTSFSLPHGGVIQLPQTGQTKCYDTTGIEISCADTGQDGEIQAGVAWPNPRFTVGTGTEADCVTDNLTGLMWAKNGTLAGTRKNWNDAIDYANNLTLCGYSDWRLPNVNELESLVNAETNTVTWLNSNGFTNVQSSSYYYYWSSTTNAGRTYDAWYVNMWDGYVSYTSKNSYSFYVWPVRSGQSYPQPAQLWETGQTKCYDSSGWENNLTLCGYSDWRLPNRKELRSLIDYESYAALPAGHPFTNVQSDRYWSSTTYASYTGYAYYAWYVDMWGGFVGFYYKDDYYYVWPVRSGQLGGSFDYYCDDDNDGHFDSSIDGTCTGSGCVPTGCQTEVGNDCNDSNPAVNPGATEIPNNGIDDDCNPATPTATASGNGYNYPTPLFRASLSLNVTAPTTGSLKYYYSRSRLSLNSTSI